MNSSKAFLLILAFCLRALTEAKAAPLCHKVHNSGPTTTPTLSRLLDPLKLKKQSFELRGKELFDTHYNTRIGTLTIKSPKYLYEWADKSYHQSWVTSGGISHELMKDILKEPPQLSGRGYYTSTNPFDSADYGNALTTFRTKGPLVLVDDNPTVTKGSTEFMLRLQRAGIDGVINTTRPSWMAIINPQHLKIASNLEDSNWNSLDKLSEISRIEGNLTKQNFWKSLSSTSIIRKIHENRITELEREQIFNAVTSNNPQITGPLWASTDIGKKIYSIARQHVLPHYPNIRSSQDLANYLRFASTFHTADRFPGLRKGPRSEEYSNILRYFDVKTLSLLYQGKQVMDLASFDYLKQEAAKLKKRRDQIDFTKIHTTDDFLKAAGHLVGQKLQIRDYDVVMANEVKGEDSQLLELGVSTVEQIKNNKLLVLYDTQQASNRTKSVKTGIAFSTVGSLKKIFETDYLSIRPAQVAKTLREMPVLESGIYENPAHRAAYKGGLRAALDTFFSNDYSLFFFLSRFSNATGGQELVAYQTFMALHPLTDGNGRAGRLLFEFFRWKRSQQQEQLDLPIFDMDLIGPADQLRNLAMGAFIRQWVSAARNDQEFLERANMAFDALLKADPEIGINFKQ